MERYPKIKWFDIDPKKIIILIIFLGLIFFLLPYLGMPAFPIYKFGVIFFVLFIILNIVEKSKIHLAKSINEALSIIGNSTMKVNSLPWDVYEQLETKFTEHGKTIFILYLYLTTVYPFPQSINYTAILVGIGFIFCLPHIILSLINKQLQITIPALTSGLSRQGRNVKALYLDWRSLNRRITIHWIVTVLIIGLDITLYSEAQSYSIYTCILIFTGAVLYPSIVLSIELHRQFNRFLKALPQVIPELSASLNSDSMFTPHKEKQYLGFDRLEFLQIGMMFLVLIFIYYFSSMMKDYFYPGKTIKPFTFTLVFSLFLLLILSWIIWRKATFFRRDLMVIAKENGVKRIKKKPADAWKYTGRYRFYFFMLDSTFLAARLLYPFRILFYDSHSMTADMLYTLQKSGSNTPSWHYSIIPSGYNKNELSYLEFYSLIQGNYNIDVIITIIDGKGDFPGTECDEINETLKATLAGVNYFRAQIKFNDNVLWMGIHGYPWEGERFRQRVIKGIEVFQAMNNELRKKYPTGNWDNREVKWDKKGDFFYLVQKNNEV